MYILNIVELDCEEITKSRRLQSACVLIGGLLYGGFSWGFWGLRFISGHCRAIRSETQINKT